MKTVFKEHSHYRIEIDKAQNFLVVKPIGFWRSVDAVPDYIDDLREGLSLLGTGTAIIVDASEMMTHPREVQEEVHLKALQMSGSFKPRVTATVVPKDAISTMQANFMARSIGKKITGFDTVEEAEAYVTSYEKN